MDSSLIVIPAWPLTVRYTECAGPTDGCYDPDTSTILVAPNAGPMWHRRYVFLHELGHWFDQHALTDNDRLRFLDLSQSRAGGWDHDGEETFADAFAACARWRRLSDDHTGAITLFAPGRRTYRRVCAWMRRVAARYPADTPGGRDAPM